MSVELSRDLTQWSVDQNGIIQLSRCRGDVNGLHLLKRSKRMALGDKLIDWTLMKSASNQQNDVVDHV